MYVHYSGYLLDGTKFDSSYDRKDAFKFRLGKGKVITGWEAVVGGMRLGQKVIVKIPPQFAYGDKSVGPIPANSPLVAASEGTCRRQRMLTRERAGAPRPEPAGKTRDAPWRRPDLYALSSAFPPAQHIAVCPPAPLLAVCRSSTWSWFAWGTSRGTSRDSRPSQTLSLARASRHTRHSPPAAAEDGQRRYGVRKAPLPHAP